MICFRKGLISREKTSGRIEPIGDERTRPEPARTGTIKKRNRTDEFRGGVDQNSYEAEWIGTVEKWRGKEFSSSEMDLIRKAEKRRGVVRSRKGCEWTGEVQSGNGIVRNSWASEQI